jgi:protein dithiol:quinone oxidoreductase
MKLLAAARGHRRAFDVAAALACFAMFGFALYLQSARALEPCPLCIFQRVAVVSLGIAFLVAALLPSLPRIFAWIATTLIALAALAGAGVAGRHVYIQSLPPDQVPVCGATLDYMMEIFSPSEVLRKVLTGSGECAKIDWTFLGLSMPAWVLICVLLLGVAGVLVNLPPKTGYANSPRSDSR